jgi:hypothetical protein
MELAMTRIGLGSGPDHLQTVDFGERGFFEAM